jgi:hypothetical protein
LLLREEETGNLLRIGLSNVDWFFMQCRTIIYRNTLLYFILTYQQETNDKRAFLREYEPNEVYQTNEILLSTLFVYFVFFSSVSSVSYLSKKLKLAVKKVVRYNKSICSVVSEPAACYAEL